MFGIIKKVFIMLLSGIVNASNHTKCVLLNNQKREIQPTLTDLHSNEYSREFHYYPFSVNLDRCVGCCNTINDLFNEVCISNKTEDLNLSVFTMIPGKNESERLINNISCDVNVNLKEQNISQINGWIAISVDVSVKNIMYVKNIIFTRCF